MVRGGKRSGAGRPRGTGKFGESTVRIRVPEGKLFVVQALLESGDQYALPLFDGRISAGFPSPTDDYSEGKLDLNHHLIHRPATTFFVRVSGDSMIGAGIHQDDLLVVDRSLSPKHQDVVIAVVDSELTVKRLSRKSGTVALMPENPVYSPLEITADMSFEIWGVVTSVIHQFR